MICSLSQHGLTRKCRPCDLLRHFDCPIVMLVIRSCQSHQQARIGDGVHPREKPLREETSGGPPLITPAYFFHAASFFVSFSPDSVAFKQRRTHPPARRPRMPDLP